MTAATIGQWQFRLGSAASPQVLTAIEEVLSVSELGADNELLDVTNFDSPTGTKEYIAGLADGKEITVEANYVPGTTVQEAAMTAADSGATRLFDMTYTGSSPNKVFSGSVVCLGYTLNPDISSQNKINFRFKISGGVTRA